MNGFNLRRMVFLFSLVALTMLSVTTTAGCSVAKQYSAAATPIATDINTDLHQWLASDETNRDAIKQAEDFLAASQSGDKAKAASLWNGPTGVRAFYVNWLDTAPMFQTPMGQTAKGIKMRNVATYDYILTIGS